MKKKNFLKYIINLVLLVGIVFLGFPTGSLAFDAYTHQHTTKCGLEILASSMGDEYANFFDENMSQVVYQYCTMPDQDEIQGSFKYHFYNPDTGKNFMGEKESSLFKLNEHYEMAVKNYKINNKQKAFEELGRALHFLEDLNTPVHTNNQNFMDAGKNVLSHVAFEKICNKVADSFNESYIDQDRGGLHSNLSREKPIKQNLSLAQLYNSTHSRELYTNRSNEFNLSFEQNHSNESLNKKKQEEVNIKDQNLINKHLYMDAVLYEETEDEDDSINISRSKAPVERSSSRDNFNLSSKIEIKARKNPTLRIEDMSYYKLNSINTIGKSSAMMASDNFHLLKNRNMTPENVAKSSIANAIKAVSGVLYKFYNVFKD